MITTSRRMPASECRRINSSGSRRLVASGLRAMLFYLVASTTAFGSVTVTGDTAVFKNFVNKLLKGATVDIDKNGMLTITVTGNLNEVGQQIKEMIDSKDRNGKAITDPKGQPVAITIDAHETASFEVGKFNGGGTQSINVSGVDMFAAPGTGLRTKGAILIHEMQEVFNSIKDGKARTKQQDPEHKDYLADHLGSAKTGENAVDMEESNITRIDEPKPIFLTKAQDPLNPNTTIFTFKAKAQYQKTTQNGKETIYIEDFLTHTVDKTRGIDTQQVTDQKQEPAKPVGGGKYFLEEDFGQGTKPGLYFFDSSTLQPFDSLPLDRPGYLGIDGFGHLYVSEQRENVVLVLDHNGSLLRELSHPLLTNPQGIATIPTLEPGQLMTGPTGLVFPIGETAYVASGNNILGFDLNNATVSVLTNPAFNNVRGLAADTDGFLWAASFGNDLVLKLDPASGEIIGGITSSELSGPEGVAVDQLGSVYVASFNNNKVLKFASDGSLDPAFQVAPILDGPKGVAVSPQSFVTPNLGPSVWGEYHTSLIISSFNNNQVFEVDLQTGALLRSTPMNSPVGVGEVEMLAPICDVNGDDLINSIDISAILAARGQKVTRPGDPRDADGDGSITITDARACTLLCTKPRCAL